MGELMAVTQATHRIAISTPLGKDALLLRGFTGSEGISRLFHFDLDLLSENDSIDFEDIVGKNVTLQIVTADGSQRYWDGFISRFSQGPQERRLTAYHAEMVPWLWFLTQTADCRIFQNQKVPDIIQEIFTDLEFHDFELHLYASYTPRDYCVQYRETDFNFVSRLMEEEGICYYFAHEDGKHTLILADDPAAHEACPNQATASYNFYGPGATYQEDLITEWNYREEFRTGAWSQTDYNFETPSTSLAVTVNGNNPYEIYDYPGEYTVRSQGDDLARIRLQEQTTPTAVSHGSGTCRNFVSGFKFTLENHYRSDWNQSYLILALRHNASRGANYEVGAARGDEFTYGNTFECIPASAQYRPPRVTPHAFVQGCQTALVVGPKGEEIYTDNYGRVKVQFYWDREGKKNENSSCWVRVSHPWAGQGWGALAIPRIGQEVVVDFLEGNPDQPIIIGRVYNAGQTPPFGLPGGAVISGVKSNSTKGGGGYNEISLNDTKGTELINIHAQYDQQKKVEHDERVNIGNDRTEQVGHNETITIGNDRIEEVKHNENIKIDNDKSELVLHNRMLQVNNDKSEQVGHNKSVNVAGDHSETISGSMNVFVLRTLTETVAINYAESVGGAMELTVGGLLAISAGGALAETVGLAKASTVGGSSSESVGGGKSLTVGADLNETVANNRTVKVQGDLKENIAGQHNESVTKEYMLQAKKIQLVATDEISLKAGDATVVLEKNGDITINGNKINVVGSGDVTIKGSKIKGN
jgi:type VI secretion system secreted protein VgrG